MEPMALMLLEQHRLSHRAIELVTGDLDDAKARHRLRNGKGPSIAWLLGHLMHYRHTALKRLGMDAPSPYGATYNDKGATDGGDYPPLADTMAAWRALHAKLEEAYASVTAAQLEAPLGRGGEDRKLYHALVFYAWHEAYHLGAIGTIRTELGLPQTAELAFGVKPK